MNGIRVAAEFAQAAIDLVTDPRIRNVRECAHRECVLLFLPAHQGRLWCSPARCGNRARVARYYRRHKISADASTNPRTPDDAEE